MFPTVDLFMGEEVRDLMGKNVKFYTKPLWKTDIRRWKGWDSRGQWPILGPVSTDVPWQLLPRLRLLTWSGLSSPSTFMCPPAPPFSLLPPQLLSLYPSIHSSIDLSFPLDLSHSCWKELASFPNSICLHQTQGGQCPPLLPLGDLEQMVGWRRVGNLTHGEKPSLILKSEAGLQSATHSQPGIITSNRIHPCQSGLIFTMFVLV